MQQTPKLDDLIDLARRSAASDDPIDELEAAARLKSELDDLTDALLGHFVDQARRAGRSWAQIGAALGVTKQAAQQRHASAASESTFVRLFQRLASKVTLGARFTPRVKLTIVAAEAAAHRLGHGYIGTEHLLLGQWAEPESVAVEILDAAGVTEADTEAAVVDLVGRGAETTGHLDFTPRAKEALELALREALDLGHNYIGTEHVLLGLLREGSGLAALHLTGQGLTHEGARAEVVRILTRRLTRR